MSTTPIKKLLNEDVCSLSARIPKSLFKALINKPDYNDEEFILALASNCKCN